MNPRALMFAAVVMFVLNIGAIVVLWWLSPIGWLSLLGGMIGLTLGWLGCSAMLRVLRRRRQPDWARYQREPYERMWREHEHTRPPGWHP